MAPSVASFADLLRSAVTDPGILSAAYRQFHYYSLGNQLLAWSQCLARDLQPGPMATYPQVEGTRPARPQGREGDHALPAGHGQASDRHDDGTTRPSVFTRFIYRPHWFVLAQTDGAETRASADPSLGRRIERSPSLDVIEVPFDATDGNVLGFARERSIADHRRSTRCRTRRGSTSWRHVLLGHTAEGEQNDGERDAARICASVRPKRSRCCAARRSTCPASSYCRGYIQNWWGAGNPIPERSAQRILKAADQILKAGTIGAEAQHEGRDLRSRLDGRSGAGEPAAGTPALRRGTRVDRRRIRGSRA